MPWSGTSLGSAAAMRIARRSAVPPAPDPVPAHHAGPGQRADGQDSDAGDQGQQTVRAGPGPPAARHERRTTPCAGRHAQRGPSVRGQAVSS